MMRNLTRIGFISIAMLVALSSLSSAQQLNRAPDVLPGTIPEMRTPEFWIARVENPDQVVLTPAQIMAKNNAFIARMKSDDPYTGVSSERQLGVRYWWTGLVPTVTDLSTIPDQALADTVRAKVEQGLGRVGGRRPPTTGEWLPYSEGELQSIRDEVAFDRIAIPIQLESGITVAPTLLRHVPTYPPKQVSESNATSHWDNFNIAVVRMATPVTIMHRSLSGRYLFIQGPDCYGWVRSIDVALGSEDMISQFADPDNFVVCTDDEVAFYGDNSCTVASGYFKMGDILPLVSRGSKLEILIPFRNANGQLSAERAWLAEGANANIGWLPYTKRNIITTAFRLLDTPYDWTGGWFGRAHEGYLRDLFHCFGFDLPNHGNLFTLYAGTERVAIPPEGIVDRRVAGTSYGVTPPPELTAAMYPIIFQGDPWTTIQAVGGSGHTQLYIGEIDGEPYVFDLHGYGYSDEEGNQIEIRRTCIANMGQGVPGYALPNTITFSDLK